MKIVKIVGAIVLFALTAMAQAPRVSGERDILSTAGAHGSLNMFAAALQTTGMATMLAKPGTWTVFAVSDKAFANLSKGDLQVLLTNQAAMHFLLANYVAHGSIATLDTASMSSSTTVTGAKLRSDSRGGEVRVNGARIIEEGIHCSNGVVHVLDMFDPGLVHEAVALAGPKPTGNLATTRLRLVPR